MTATHHNHHPIGACSMTTTTPALEGAALLLHLVDRCERGVALAEEYRVLRDGIRQLGGVAYDQHGDLYRDRFRAQMEAAADLIAENDRLRRERNSWQKGHETAEAQLVHERRKNARLERKVRDLEAHLTIAHQNVRAMRDGGTP